LTENAPGDTCGCPSQRNDDQKGCFLAQSEQNNINESFDEYRNNYGGFWSCDGHAWCVGRADVVMSKFFSIMPGCVIIWVYRCIFMQFSHLHTLYSSSVCLILFKVAKPEPHQILAREMSGISVTSSPLTSRRWILVFEYFPDILPIIVQTFFIDVLLLMPEIGFSWLMCASYIILMCDTHK